MISKIKGNAYVLKILHPMYNMVVSCGDGGGEVATNEERIGDKNEVL